MSPENYQNILENMHDGINKEYIRNIDYSLRFYYFRHDSWIHTIEIDEVLFLLKINSVFMIFILNYSIFGL